jgi:hypothetical protein
VVTVGFTEIVGVVAPVFHKYVTPPFPVKIVVDPVQIAEGPVIEIDKEAATLTS